MHPITDEDEFIAAFREWVEEKAPLKYGRKKPKPTIWDERDTELRKTNPLYAEVADALRGPSHAKSMVSG